MDKNQAGQDDVEAGTEHLGAVEGEKPTDAQQGNPNGDGINDEGLPDDALAQCEDVLGAKADGTEG